MLAIDIGLALREGEDGEGEGDERSWMFIVAVGSSL
jgi:hypothetical protein